MDTSVATIGDIHTMARRVVEEGQALVEVSITGDHSQPTTDGEHLWEAQGLHKEVAMGKAPTMNSVDRQVAVTEGLATPMEEALAAAALGVLEVPGSRMG